MSNPKVVAAVTAKLMAAIEAGVKPWQRPWVGGGGPVNHKSNKAYRGINVFTLIFTAMERGYKHNRWVPKGLLQEMKKAGKWTVLNDADKWGETDQRVEVLFFKIIKRRNDDGDDVRIPLMRYTRVLNIAHIAELQDWVSPELPNGAEPVAAAEAHIVEQTALGRLCPVTDSMDGRAFYRPSADKVFMPARASFKSTEGWYSTLLHEYGHSTGHESRLDRDLSGTFGTGSYAFEEAIAEMTACMLLGEFGIDADIPNSASYLDGWMKVKGGLRDNPGLLSQAAHEAQKAADYFMNRYQKEDKSE